MGSAHWAGFSYCAWPYCSVRNIPPVRWNVFQHPNPILQMRTVRPGRLWTRTKWIQIRNTKVKVFQAYTWLHLTSTFSGTANTVAFYLNPLCVAKMMWGKKLRIYFKKIYFYEVSSYLSKAQSLWARTYSVARLWPVFGSQNLMGCWLSLLPETTNPFVGCQSTHFTSAPCPVKKVKIVHFEISQTHWEIKGCTPYNRHVKLNEKHHRRQVTKQNQTK